MAMGHTKQPTGPPTVQRECIHGETRKAKQLFGHHWRLFHHQLIVMKGQRERIRLHVHKVCFRASRLLMRESSLRIIINGETKQNIGLENLHFAT
jgi:hypothetical protein